MSGRFGTLVDARHAKLANRARDAVRRIRIRPQAAPPSRFLAQILETDTVDTVVDDASHADESILVTFESIHERLVRNFVYFVEDNKTVYFELSRRYPQHRVEPFGEMTVVTGSG